MRFVTVLGAAVLVIGLAVPSAADENAITHGEFAVLLLQASAGFTGEVPEADAALRSMQELELLPESWTIEGTLTHGELADVLGRFGASYVPADRGAPVSSVFAKALLRRELSTLREHLATKLGHGFSINHILDMGVDRAVSPSTF